MAVSMGAMGGQRCRRDDSDFEFSIFSGMGSEDGDDD